MHKTEYRVWRSNEKEHEAVSSWGRGVDDALREWAHENPGCGTSYVNVVPRGRRDLKLLRVTQDERSVEIIEGW